MTGPQLPTEKLQEKAYNSIGDIQRVCIVPNPYLSNTVSLNSIHWYSWSWAVRPWLYQSVGQMHKEPGNTYWPTWHLQQLIPTKASQLKHTQTQPQTGNIKQEEQHKYKAMHSPIEWCVGLFWKKIFTMQKILMGSIWKMFFYEICAWRNVKLSKSWNP